MPQWDAEIELSPEDAARLIRGQFPELEFTGVEFFGEGWDNFAFRLSREAGAPLIFRFPRRQLGAECTHTELRVTPLVPDLPLPITRSLWVGEPAGEFPWRFGGYEMIPGRPAVHCAEAAIDWPALGESLGTFFAAVRDRIDVAAARAMNAPEDDWERIDAGHRVPQILERLDQLTGFGLIDGPEPWRTQAEAILAANPRPVASTLCHGDFSLRHVLIGDDGRATGIIDWGDVHCGDPAVDLAILWWLPLPARRRFLEAYGQIDERTALLLRLRALSHACGLAHWAHDVGLRDEKVDALRVLRHLAEAKGELPT